MKRILLVVLTLTCVLSLLLFTNFADYDPQDEASIKQQEAIKTLKQLTPKVEKDNYNDPVISQLENDYISEYGGVYLDAEGILNVNIVGEAKNIKNLLKDSNVKYHNVKYTKKQLSEINNSLCDRLIELGISAMELDQANNKVIVYLENPDDTKKIDNIKKIIDSPAIEYKKFESEIKY